MKNASAFIGGFGVGILFVALILVSQQRGTDEKRDFAEAVAFNILTKTIKPYCFISTPSNKETR